MKENQISLSTGAELLYEISNQRGLLWEKIERLSEKMIETIESCEPHVAGTEQSEEMKNVYPLKQHIEGGLYTRELFMPKGSLVVSMIHKQNHPSFLLKGKLSFIADDGTVKHVEAPHTVFTKEGTQRVLYIHEDVEWCCVYKTDATNFEEAEADVYTNNYRELPIELINKNKLLCQ
jgi:hypothetical protein|tara:strand:+ start:63 stop:593 length:531 start_codon:yes stop_codon:yes gene_type:complete